MVSLITIEAEQNKVLMLNIPKYHPLSTELHSKTELLYLMQQHVRYCKVCFTVLFHFLVFMSFILKFSHGSYLFYAVSVMLPLLSCIPAIGSSVQCVMF